jgi:hypothetical protein
MNISASSYTILQQKVNLHTAGCGRLNTPSGVTVTPKRMKASTLATRPLKHKNNIANEPYSVFVECLNRDDGFSTAYIGQVEVPLIEKDFLS